MKSLYGRAVCYVVEFIYAGWGLGRHVPVWQIAKVNYNRCGVCSILINWCCMFTSLPTLYNRPLFTHTPLTLYIQLQSTSYTRIRVHADEIKFLLSNKCLSKHSYRTNNIGLNLHIQLQIVSNYFPCASDLEQCLYFDLEYSHCASYKAWYTMIYLLKHISRRSNQPEVQ